MRSIKVLDAINALAKIQALAAAAGYLTSNQREEQLCFELIEMIEEIAQRGVEAENE